MTPAPRPRARRTIRRLAPAAAVVLGLALGACGSDDDPNGGGADASTTTTSTTVAGQGGGGADSTTTTSTTPVGGGVAEVTTTEAPTTTQAPETTAQTTTTTEPPAGDCLVGVWNLRSQEFLDEIMKFVPVEQTPGFEGWEYVSGEYVVTLSADGTYRGERRAWTHKILSSQGNLITTITSDDNGTYTVEGDQISISDPGGDATVTIGLEVDGVVQEMPMGMGTQQVSAPAVSGTGTYVCEGDVLTVTILDLPDMPAGAEFVSTFDRAG